jgi:hypothetical protein
VLKEMLETLNQPQICFECFNLSRSRSDVVIVIASWSVGGGGALVMGIDWGGVRVSKVVGNYKARNPWSNQSEGLKVCMHPIMMTRKNDQSDEKCWKGLERRSKLNLTCGGWSF